MAAVWKPLVLRSSKRLAKCLSLDTTTKAVLLLLSELRAFASMLAFLTSTLSASPLFEVQTSIVTEARPSAIVKFSVAMWGGKMAVTFVLVVPL